MAIFNKRNVIRIFIGIAVNHIQAYDPFYCCEWCCGGDSLKDEPRGAEHGFQEEGADLALPIAEEDSESSNSSMSTPRAAGGPNFDNEFHGGTEDNDSQSDAISQLDSRPEGPLPHETVTEPERQLREQLPEEG